MGSIIEQFSNENQSTHSPLIYANRSVSSTSSA